MPTRTRAEMHIALDLALEALDATPMNRFDPGAKDIFLNRTITTFVNDVIKKTNQPDENKRIPFSLLTYGDVINKYNDIYTLVKVDDTLTPLTVTDVNYYQYTLPGDLTRFEASYCHLKPINCINYPTTNILTATLGSGAGNVDDGKHYYFITYVYPTLESTISVANIANVTVLAKGTNGKVELTTIPARPTGCTSIKIYRTKVGEAWHKGRLLATLSNDENHYHDNTADSSLGALYTGSSNDIILPNVLLNTYDIIAFNNNPYGGKKKYIGTILETNGLRLYHLQRYIISKVGIIYIKKPAVLSDSVTQCDLPESVHDQIIDDTAKFISAATSSDNYQQLLNEAKQVSQ